MADVTTPRFACDRCGKQFAWKPQLAGKQAKCKCGAVLTVPMTVRSAAPHPPPPVQGEPPNPFDDAGAYDFAEDAAPAPPVAKRALPVTPVAAAAVVPAGRGGTTAAALGYRGQVTAEEKRKADRFSFSAMLDMKRDVYAPAAVLLLGFGGIIAWAMAAISAGALAIVIVSIGTAVVTVVKTVVLTLGAIIIAPRFGISFGDLRTAIFKIAAIIVFTDACALWSDHLWNSAMPGRMNIRFMSLNLFMTGAIISLLCYIMFDMEREESAMFAVPMALVSRVVGFALTMVAAGMIAGAAGSSKSRRGGSALAATPAVSGGTSAVASATDGDGDENDDAGEGGGESAPDPLAAPSPAATSKLSPKDQAVQKAIGMQLFVYEVQELRSRAKRLKAPLADAFYAAGAPRVYVDIRDNTPLFRFGHVYVELPTDPAARAACFTLASTPGSLGGMVIDPSLLKDAGQKFLAFDLPAF